MLRSRIFHAGISSGALTLGDRRCMHETNTLAIATFFIYLENFTNKIVDKSRSNKIDDLKHELEVTLLSIAKNPKCEIPLFI